MPLLVSNVLNVRASSGKPEKQDFKGTKIRKEDVKLSLFTDTNHDYACQYLIKYTHIILEPSTKFRRFTGYGVNIQVVTMHLYTSKSTKLNLKNNI